MPLLLQLPIPAGVGPSGKTGVSEVLALRLVLQLLPLLQPPLKLLRPSPPPTPTSRRWGGSAFRAVASG
eukprot:9438857-Alexandrium_andersonii.AAC.1